MQNARTAKIRDALWRLNAPTAVGDDPLGAVPPLFLRAPSIAVLWVMTLLAVVGLLAVSRIRLPHAARLIHPTESISAKEDPCHPNK